MSDVPVIREDVSNWLRSIALRDEGPVLQKMHALASERGFPIVGPEVGRLLAQVAQMLQAKRIFELGSGFGYSTLWFARAVGPDGVVFHTDGDAENTAQARRFLDEAGVADRVRFHTGDAIEALALTKGQFDIVFCDVDKHQYPDAYRAFADRVRVGGAVLIDNLVWSGRVASGGAAASTQGVRDYINLMWGDDRYLSSLLPVRDGVGLSLRLR